MYENGCTEGRERPRETLLSTPPTGAAAQWGMGKTQGGRASGPGLGTPPHTNPQTKLQNMERNINFWNLFSYFYSLNYSPVLLPCSGQKDEHFTFCNNDWNLIPFGIFLFIFIPLVEIKGVVWILPLPPNWWVLMGQGFRTGARRADFPTFPHWSSCWNFLLYRPWTGLGGPTGLIKLKLIVQSRSERDEL